VLRIKVTVLDGFVHISLNDQEVATIRIQTFLKTQIQRSIPNGRLDLLKEISQFSSKQPSYKFTASALLYEKALSFVEFSE